MTLITVNSRKIDRFINLAIKHPEKTCRLVERWEKRLHVLPSAKPSASEVTSLLGDAFYIVSQSLGMQAKDYEERLAKGGEPSQRFENLLQRKRDLLLRMAGLMRGYINRELSTWNLPPIATCNDLATIVKSFGRNPNGWDPPTMLEWIVQVQRERVIRGLPPIDNPPSVGEKELTDREAEDAFQRQCDARRDEYNEISGRDDATSYDAAKELYEHTGIPVDKSLKGMPAVEFDQWRKRELQSRVETRSSDGCEEKQAGLVFDSHPKRETITGRELAKLYEVDASCVRHWKRKGIIEALPEKGPKGSLMFKREKAIRDLKHKLKLEPMTREKA